MEVLHLLHEHPRRLVVEQREREGLAALVTHEGSEGLSAAGERHPMLEAPFSEAGMKPLVHAFRVEELSMLTLARVQLTQLSRAVPHQRSSYQSGCYTM